MAVISKTINIIGCGNVGKTLGKLWHESGTFEIGSILNNSRQSTLAARDFIGAGRVGENLTTLNPADIYLISTPDSQIEQSCNALSKTTLLRPGNIVIHCSGALASSILHSAQQQGAYVASMHPVKSFADASVSVATFNGTYCGIEGDELALNVMRPAIQAINAIPFQVSSEHKTIYHAASVMVCNYLNALFEVGIQAYVKAGLERTTAMQVMQPIVRGTVDNIFDLGTVKALTGPIARGDDAIVKQQLNALTEWNDDYAALYQQLGRVTLELSRLQGTATDKALSDLDRLLNAHNSPLK